MHELSVCLALLQQVESIAAERGAASVVRIELEIGPLSGVEADLLRHAWPLAAAGTLAETAELVIDTGELEVQCTSCGARSVVVPNRLLCGACGDFRTRVVAGEEMTLLRLELDTSRSAPDGLAAAG
jgi:hydrogenase nickel incorporation protein HypA/HybF